MVPHWDPFGAEGYVIDESQLGPWDILKFDGNRVPGTIPEGGIKVTRKMSIKVNKPHGGDGGTVVQNGYEPAEVDITIRVCTKDEWEGLQVILGHYWRFPGKDSKQDRPGQKRITTPAPTAEALQVPALLQRLTVVDSTQVPPLLQRVALDLSVVGSTQTVVQDRAVKSTGAIDVESPYFDFPNKVAAIVLLSVSNPEPGPEKGTRIIRLKAYEYIAASKKSATRKTVGKVAQVAEHQLRTKDAVKNAASVPPSATDGVPALLRKPASGST